jgi:hypothetical protein
MTDQQGYPIMGVVVVDLPLAKEPKDVPREEYAAPAVATGGPVITDNHLLAIGIHVMASINNE